MEVLWLVYRVLFYDLPPVSRESGEFLSYAPGSLRALALREEVSKMLQKGTLEVVDQPGPGFYSRLFLVQKVTGDWRPIIDLSVLNMYVTMTLFKVETVVSVLGSIRKAI